MSVKKRKCCYCKKYFLAETMKTLPVGLFCSDQHILAYATNKAQKALERERRRAKRYKKKVDAVRKREFQLNDIKLRKKSAQKAFNAYIRLRDEKLPCISCDRHHEGQYHAGHYKTTAARPDLRFNEDNCHKQCSRCNNFLSGNIENYRPNLIRKIGRDRFDALELEKPVKYTCDDYLAIEKKYKSLVKLVG